ncbi:MAG: putative toxin-antitoxin system toxin component, PIN family [Anaerolineae bacterium CG2_30_64_16]|nr:MAG: putative toxin-antitoxin system toxin component, PIN family [Anaerolineae bacterium CG2_30_64_16]
MAENFSAAPRRLIVVLDTNALVRVALAKSPLARVLRCSLERGDFVLLTSGDILNEIGRVLCYPRIAIHHALSEAAIEEFELAVRKAAVVVPGLYVVRKIEADPSDDMFLACALEGDADYIVSEDPHVRDLKTYQGIQIISMAQFSEKLGLSVARPASPQT